MSLSDDDQILATPYDSGTKFETFREGNTKVNTMYKDEAGIEESKLSVFLEVTGAGYVNERAGVDVVAILDVGDSMKGDKLNALKAVMRLLIDKLSSSDRLSLVTFSKDPQRLCPLRQLTVVSKAEIEKLVSDLETNPGKDINGGIEMALEMINGRKYASGQRVAILLMSDGNQLDALKHVSIETLPVYTFGFGVDDQKSMVLKDIAEISGGGSYCAIDVSNSVSGNLRAAVSECMANLLGVVVNDLNLTIKKANSTTKIDNISVGIYSQSHSPSYAFENDHVTVSLGDVYANETCKVKVDLLLSPVTTPQRTDLLHISYSCRTHGKVFDSSSQLIKVTRVAHHVPEVSNQQVDVDKFQGIYKLLKAPAENLGTYFGRQSLFSTGDKDKLLENAKIEDAPSKKVDTSFLKLLEQPAPRHVAPVVVSQSDYSNDVASKASNDNTFSIQKFKFGDPSQVPNEVQNKTDAEKTLGPEEHLTMKSGDRDSIASGKQSTRILEVKPTESHSIAVGDQSQKIQKFGSSDPLALVPIEVVNKNEVANVQKSSSDLIANSHFNENIADHLKEAFDSVKIIQGILTDYMKQYAGFLVEKDVPSNAIRSRNIKALAGHLSLAFASVKAIEDILLKVGSTPVINLEDESIGDFPVVVAEVKNELKPEVQFTAKPAKSDSIASGNQSLKIQEFGLSDLLPTVPIEDAKKNVVDDVQESSFDSMVSSHHGENITDHLKQAFDSVKIIREILIDYMTQHIEFEMQHGVSSDTVHSNNVKALRSRLYQAFDSIKAIEDILQKVERNRSSVDTKGAEDGNEVDRQHYQKSTESDSSTALPNQITKIQEVEANDPVLEPIIIVNNNVLEKVDLKHEPSVEENITDHMKQALDSVQIIRDILNDYVKQHIGFEANEGESINPVRTKKVKDLSGHLCSAFDSVNAIEDILQNARSCVV